MAYSDYATTTAMTLSIPVGVLYLTATAVSQTQIGLAWNEIPDTTGYTLSRYKGSGDTMEGQPVCLFLHDPAVNMSANQGRVQIKELSIDHEQNDEYWEQIYSGPDTAYSDTGLEPDTAYKYRVVAIMAGDALYSNIAEATTPPVPPDGPARIIRFEKIDVCIPESTNIIKGG